jgi:hypothetical protein
MPDFSRDIAGLQTFLASPAARLRIDRRDAPSMKAPAFLADLLIRLHHLNLCRLDLTQSFKHQHFQALRLGLGPCRPDPPSYMRLTVAISRVFERWGFG